MLESIYNVDMNCRVIDTGMLDCTQRFGKAATRIWYLLHSVGVITAPKLPENSLLVICRTGWRNGASLDQRQTEATNCSHYCSRLLIDMLLGDLCRL